MTNNESAPSLKVVLEGGLGNRMRVAAAAAQMCGELGPVKVLWLEQWGMRCRFDSLFQAPSLNEMNGHSFCLRDASKAESLLMAPPQARNFKLPKLVQRICFRDVIFSEEVMPRRMAGFDFLAWARQGRCLMHAYRDFYKWDVALLPKLFSPTPEINAFIDSRCSDFSTHAIGVHVRRTDNQESIADSPLELFFEAIDSNIDMHADTNVYLATDDEPTKVAMRERYGKRIITSSAEADRDSTAGIIEGLVEMFALSRTSHIYGSAGSTFSEMAAALGGKPFEVVRKDKSKPYQSGLWIK